MSAKYILSVKDSKDIFCDFVNNDEEIARLSFPTLKPLETRESEVKTEFPKKQLCSIEYAHHAFGISVTFEYDENDEAYDDIPKRPVVYQFNPLPSSEELSFKKMKDCVFYQVQVKETFLKKLHVLFIEGLKLFNILNCARLNIENYSFVFDTVENVECDIDICAIHNIVDQKICTWALEKYLSSKETDDKLNRVCEHAKLEYNEEEDHSLLIAQNKDTSQLFGMNAANKRKMGDVRGLDPTEYPELIDLTTRQIIVCDCFDSKLEAIVSSDAENKMKIGSSIAKIFHTNQWKEEDSEKLSKFNLKAEPFDSIKEYLEDGIKSTDSILYFLVSCPVTTNDIIMSILYTMNHEKIQTIIWDCGRRVTPIKYAKRVSQCCHDFEKILIGPSDCGIYRPSCLGTIEDMSINKKPGNVAVICRDKEMLRKVCAVVNKCTSGVYEAIAIGDVEDRFILSSNFSDQIYRYNNYLDVQMIIAVEADGCGGSDFSVVQGFIEDGILTKPLICWYSELSKNAALSKSGGFVLGKLDELEDYITDIHRNAEFHGKVERINSVCNIENQMLKTGQSVEDCDDEGNDTLIYKLKENA